MNAALTHLLELPPELSAKAQAVPGMIRPLLVVAGSSRTPNLWIALAMQVFKVAEIDRVEDGRLGLSGGD
jgi:hypothetical protein